MPRHMPGMPRSLHGVCQKSGKNEIRVARLKLTLTYEGTRYSGWQMQAFTTKDRPITIQGELERALETIIGQRVVVYGAGRTDSGVHAEAQVCHIDLPEDKMRIDWQRALNVLLPYDIRVLSVEEAAPEFHARKSALRKRYAYTLWMGRDRAVPRLQAFVWSTPTLDLDRMRVACDQLTGCHDFASFQNSGTPIASTIRTLFSFTVSPNLAGRLICPPEWPVATFIVEGDGFLKQMVRNLMGLLVWVGQGKLQPESIPAMIAAKDRRALPSPSAPAQGLTLLEVIY